MDEEEVVAVAAERRGRGDEEGEGEFLGLLELGGRVGDFPGVPVLQQDRLEVGSGEYNGEVVVAGAVEDVGEALVSAEAGEDLQGLGCTVGYGVGSRVA